MINTNDEAKSPNTSTTEGSRSPHRRTASFSRSFSSGISLNSSSSVRPPIVKEFESNGWSFKSVRSSISSAMQIETLSHQLGFPLPTMFFGCNKIYLENPLFNFVLQFTPLEAIKKVSNSSDSVPVKIAASHAEFWKQRSESEVIFDYDWTYTPQLYQGSLSRSDENSESEPQIESTGLEINFARLKLQDPILFFDENILFEDELGDNGISLLTVKLRVMEYGFYVLLNHFLRVDQVMFKTCSTRFYHEFSNNYILREFRECEDSFDSIIEKMTLAGTNFKDNEAVQQLLPVRTKYTEKITFI